MAGNISTQFKPGQSGNPGGLPKGIGEVQRLARQYTTEAISELARLCQHAESEAARVAACNAILDRGWGKPKQEVEHGGTDGEPIKHTIEVRFVKPDRDLAPSRT